MTLNTFKSLYQNARYQRKILYMEEGWILYEGRKSEIYIFHLKCGWTHTSYDYTTDECNNPPPYVDKLCKLLNFTEKIM